MSADAQAGGGAGARGSGDDGGREQLRLSGNDAEKLRQQRLKKGFCPKCGEVKTHRKQLMKLVPQVRIIALAVAGCRDHNNLCNPFMH